MEEDKIIYNIDELTLNLCCPYSLFNTFCDLPTGFQDIRDGYQLTIIEKDNEFNPNILYLHITYFDNKNIGVIKCEKFEQTATLWIDNEIFYTPFTSDAEGKISSIDIIEPMLFDLGFDLTTSTIGRIKICRDSQWNVLSEIETLSNNPNYKPVIANQVKDNCHLTDMYYFGLEGSNNCETQVLRRKKACVISNLIGSLRLRVFCLSDIIKDLTHEDFINEFNGFSKKDKRKVYRSEITFNDAQFQRYLSSNCQIYNDYFILSEYYNQSKLKELFDYFIYDLLRFQDKDSLKFISI